MKEKVVLYGILSLIVVLLALVLAFTIRTSLVLKGF